jgi:starch phosphorylase
VVEAAESHHPILETLGHRAGCGCRSTLASMLPQYRLISELTRDERVAYFSMEIALAAEIPTYAGGLGMLAGDTLRAAADLEVPVVAVTLVSRAGYFRQALDADGRQTESPDTWDPARWATRLPAAVAVPIEGREVWLSAWLYVIEGHTGFKQPVILLDTDVPLNARQDREITHYLYGGDPTYRLKQEIVLGIGGMRMLQALGFRIRKYHMNEGHSALLTLALLHRYAYPSNDVRPGELPYDIPRLRESCVFTTHTPVTSAHDQYSYDMVERVLGDAPELGIMRRLNGFSQLNLTHLALSLSDFVNGVAKRHAEVSQKLYPDYRVHSVTNGIHPGTWCYPHFAKLYDTYAPGWALESAALVRADRIPDDAIWDAHRAAKLDLIARVKAETGAALDPEVPILGFARRMTAYKRPDLLFANLERLKAIAQRFPIQLVFAGKAHPNDQPGKQLIMALHKHIRELAPAIAMAYLPNYDMTQARALVSGADVWLNTPLPPLEASGTSGMKAALNGIPSLSVLDGWWHEGCIEDVNGWAIGDGSTIGDNDASALYDKLEQKVLPLYYDDRPGWIRVMKGAIGKSAAFFSAHRMMRRYVTEAYLR